MEIRTVLLVECARLGVVLASVLIGWAVTVLVLRAAKVPEPKRRDRGAEDPRILEAPAPAIGVHRGGTWVGILERAAIATCIVYGQAALIAAVVAVKGLGRFAELRDDPTFAERFLIGTLTSMLTASWVALLGMRLIDTVL